MPTKSTGCIACRRRKIRCDEGRPGCARCTTYGIRCPGYSASRARGIEFKDQTTLTVQRAEHHYKTKTLSSPGSIESTATSPSALSEQGEYTSTHSDAESEHSTSRDIIAQKDIAFPSMKHVWSPDAERSQLYEEFISTYLPVVQKGAQNGHFTCYVTIARRRSEHPALERGMDAFSLVQLGSLYKDQRILQEAVRQYGIALRYVSASIARGDFLYNDDVLAAISCLTSCELYEEIAGDGEGWGRHVEGLNQLTAARGPQSFKSELSLLLYSNMRHGSLLYALISRKAPFMAAPAWRKLAFQSPLVRDQSTQFYDVAIQVPGVLQAHDEIDTGAPTAVTDIDQVLEESTRLDAELKNWYAEWQASSTIQNKNECELRPIEEFRAFTSLVPDRTFECAYRFPDFLVGYLYSVYWMVMFHLRSNIQSLHKLRHRILDDWYPPPTDTVPEDELLDYVLDLCRCIPTFVQPESNSAGNIGAFLPMRTAAMYFTERGHWQLLRWVGAVRNNMFVKGLAPPGVKNAGKEPSTPVASPKSSTSL